MLRLIGRYLEARVMAGATAGRIPLRPPPVTPHRRPDGSWCAGWPNLDWAETLSDHAQPRPIAVERQPGALVLTLVCSFSSPTRTGRCHAETWLQAELGGVTPQPRV
jgi:hypothetical protein